MRFTWAVALRVGADAIATYDEEQIAGATSVGLQILHPVDERC